jgi:hypothetical protein
MESLILTIIEACNHGPTGRRALYAAIKSGLRAIKAVIPPKSTRRVKQVCDFALRRAQSRRAILQRHQAISRYRNTLRKDRAQLPCRIASGLRARLAQMTTDPS